MAQNQSGTIGRGFFYGGLLGMIGSFVWLLLFSQNEAQGPHIAHIPSLIAYPLVGPVCGLIGGVCGAVIGALVTDIKIRNDTQQKFPKSIKLLLFALVLTTLLPRLYHSLPLSFILSSKFVMEFMLTIVVIAIVIFKI